MCAACCRPLACHGKGKDAQRRTGNEQKVPPSPRTDMDMDVNTKSGDGDGDEEENERDRRGQRQGAWI